MTKVIKQEYNRIFAGLPPFFGGKRKLVRLIMSHAVGKTFVDAFFGGGSVSLYAKALNYRVIANDYSYYAMCLGKAFIENNTFKLDKQDMLLMNQIVPRSVSVAGYCENNFAGRLFTLRHSRFIDTACNIINREIQNSVRFHVLESFMIKFMLGLRPWSNMSTRYGLDFLEKPFENKGKYEEKIASSGLCFDNFMPIYSYCLKIMGKINQSIFTNGKENLFYNQDVLDFIDRIEGDTVYVDPPYFGSDSYDSYYSRLVSILMQKDFVPEKSKFNREEYFDTLNRLFEKCNKFERFILSYHSEKIAPEEILSLVRKHRPAAEMIKIPYRYSIGTVHNFEKKKHKIVDELLIVG